MFFFYIHGLTPQLWIIVSNMCPIYQNIKPSGFGLHSFKKVLKSLRKNIAKIYLDLNMWPFFLIVLFLVYAKRALRFQSSKIDMIPLLESLEYTLSESTCFQNAILLSGGGC